MANGETDPLQRGVEDGKIADLETARRNRAARQCETPYSSDTRANKPDTPAALPLMSGPRQDEAAAENEPAGGDARASAPRGGPNGIERRVGAEDRRNTSRSGGIARSNRRINHEKVARLRAEIEEGSYIINATRVADKFIEREGG